MTPARRITSAAVAASLTLAAAQAPASAIPFNQNANGSLVPALTAARPTHSSSVSAQPTIVRVSAPSGFDWGDAGIGAAGGIAISMLGLGSALAISGQRARGPATRRA